MGSAVFHDAYMVTGVNNSEQNVRISYSESYNAATNKSTVTLTSVEIASNLFLGTCVFRGIVKFNGTAVKTYPTGTSSYQVTIPGGLSNYAAVSGGGGGSIQVEHDALGAASFTITLIAAEGNYFGAAYGGGMFGVASGKTATPALTTHPRASTISSASASVATQGTFALSVARNSAAFYHKATFKIAGTTLATSSAFASSLSYTVPRSWFNSYPNDTSKTVTVSVQTYTDSSCATAVGSAVTTTFTMTADSGMKPTVASGWATVAPYNTGAVSGITGYVKGYSKAQVTFDSGKITMANNATIASCSVACQGAAVSSSPYRTAVLSSTSVSVVCTVTDSRGRTASQSFTLSVMDYAKPALSGISVFRCAQNGTADEDGTHYSVKATVTCSSLNGQNTASLVSQIAPSGGSYGSSTSLTGSMARVLGPISADLSYTLRLTATDSLGNTALYYSVIPSRKWAMKFRPGGSGVAFGKAAEYDAAFEVSSDWTVKLGQPLPISSGGTGASTAAGALANMGYAEGSSYIKFPNGVLIQWGGATMTLNGGWLTATPSFSIAFVGTYYVFATGSRNSSAYTTTPWFDCNTSGNITHSATSATICAKGTNANGNVNYFAVGRWKS